MLFFLHDGVVEDALRRDDWRMLRWFLRAKGNIDRYVADLGRPGALTAALNWYRANIRPERFGLDRPRPLPPVAGPVLGIWSSGDGYCLEAQMRASAEHVTGNFRYQRLDGVGHFIPLDAPNQLTKVLLGFLS